MKKLFYNIIILLVCTLNGMVENKEYDLSVAISLMAMSNYSEESIKELVELGANVNVSNKGYRPLHSAAQQDCVRSTEALVHLNAFINIQDQEGDTPLHVAARFCSPHAMTTLIKLGATIDVPNKNGNTALHIAALENDMQAVKLLLASGANTNAQNNYGQKPWHLITFKQ